MPKTFEEIYAEPPEVKLRSLVEYIESNLHLIDSITKNLRECTAVAKQALGEIEKTRAAPSARDGDAQS